LHTTQLTLLTKAYSQAQLKQIDRLLKTNLEGLEVKTELCLDEKWVRVTLSGEDEAIATSYIRKEIGLCPETLENVERFVTLKGYVTEFGKAPDSLHVDIGVFKPETTPAVVPLSSLQATLVDGRKLALKKVAELYALSDDLPLTVKITNLDKADKRVGAELAMAQLALFNTWQQSLLDRLVVLGAPIQDVYKTLRHYGLNRDIANTESLGMFEHVLTCKLGTDAAGLIPKIGRDLKGVKFAVFAPRRMRELLS
jgi:hypothetical protein